MELWQAFIGFVLTFLTLISVFVIKPAFKVGVEFTSLKKSIETLVSSINSLVQSLEKLDTKNEEDHEKIFSQLQDHHDRLITIESKDEGTH